MSKKMNLTGWDKAENVFSEFLERNHERFQETGKKMLELVRHLRVRGKVNFLTPQVSLLTLYFMIPEFSEQICIIWYEDQKKYKVYLYKPETNDTMNAEFVQLRDVESKILELLSQLT